MEYFPFFGLMLDSGSRLQKTKTCTGYCIRYIVKATGEVVERVVAFPLTPRKTGLHLMESACQAIAVFNQRTEELREKLPPGFVPFVTLELRNATNLGVDAANISKDIGVNKRILKHNPRAITNHCAPHAVNLSIGHTVKKVGNIQADKFQRAMFSCILQLVNMVKCSSKQREHQMIIQRRLGEYVLSNRRCPLQFPARPMHRWDSEFYAMLVLTTMMNANRRYLVEVNAMTAKQRGNAKAFEKLKLVTRLMNTAKFILYIGIRLDVLSPLVFFMKNLQDCELDIDQFLEGIAHVRSELKLMISGVGGKYYAGFKKTLLTRGNRYQHWRGVEDFQNIPARRQIYDCHLSAAASKQLETFDRLFNAERVKKLEVYQLLSMRRFSREVTNEKQMEKFGSEQFSAVRTFFCKEVTAECTWPDSEEDTEASPFKAPALFKMEDFRKVIYIEQFVCTYET